MKLSDIYNSICIDSSVENKNCILLNCILLNIDYQLFLISLIIYCHFAVSKIKCKGELTLNFVLATA